MNSIQNNINTYVNDRINEAIIEYITKLHESYPNISVEDLTELWNENSDKQISTEKPPAAKKKHTKSETKSEDKPAPKKRTVKSEEKSAPTECSYIFTRGKTKGEKCTSKPKSGTDFCSRHTSDKGTAKEEKKKNKSDILETSSTTSSMSENIGAERVLKMNKKINKLCHERTGLVFESKDNKIVIGRLVNDTMLPLTEEDKDLCRRYNFRLPPEDAKEQSCDELEDEDEEEEEQEQKPKPVIASRILNKKDAKKAKTLLGLKDKSVSEILDEITGEEGNDSHLSEEDD